MRESNGAPGGRWRRLGRCLRLGLVASLLACGDAPSRGSTSEPGGTGDTSDTASYSARDSAGIRIVESRRPAREGGWMIEDSPVTSIGGGLDAPPEYQLHVVNDALRLSDGRIVVANSGAGEIRWYASDGRFLGRAGGRGEGPGEFAANLLNLVHVGGDSVGVYDSRLRRLTIFGPDGESSRVVRIDLVEDGARFRPVARFGDGDFLLVASIGPARRGAGPPEVERPPLRWSRSSLDGSAVALVELPGAEYVVPPFDARSMFGSMPILREFGRRTVFAAHPVGWITGDTGRAELRYRERTSGAVSIAARWSAEPRSISRAEMDRERERREGFDVGNLRSSAGMVEPHETHPYFDALFVNPAGYVWIRADRGPDDAADHRFLVFDDAGVWMDTVRMPEGLTVLAIGDDRVVGTRTDELGIERVVLHRLVER